MGEPLAKKVINSADLTPENDINNIKEIIKLVKKNVEQLNITINKEFFVKIGAGLKSFYLDFPVDARLKVGAKGETIINVKYK